MRTILFCILAALAATGVACMPSTVYEIEMTPEDGKIGRKLTISTEAPILDLTAATQPTSQPATAPATRPRSISDEDLAAIARLYPPRPQGQAAGDVFSGTFTDRMPNDVGGRSLYLNQTTSLGSARLYIEDFRGNDETAVVMERTFQAADTFVDLIAGYLKTRMGTEKDFDKLDAFLRGQFRRDLKNVAMYVWLDSQERRDAAGEKPEGSECFPTPRYVARVLVYLVARGYIEPADVPNLTRVFMSNGTHEEDQLLIDLLKRIVARVLTVKAGLTAEAAKKIQSRFADDAPGDDFYTYVGKVYGLPASRPAPPAASQPNPTPATQPVRTAEDVLSELQNDIFHLHFAVFGDRVSASMATQNQPIVTNGTWDPKTRRVTWATRLDMRDQPIAFLPRICYALWTLPDVPFQQKHFGKVAVDGPLLLSYGLWRATLTERRGREWDAAVAGMKGSQDLPALKAFRFSDEPKPPATEPKDGKPTFNDDYCRKGARLIAEGLAPKESPATAPAAVTTCPVP
ncbi:MAG: hypothetical protein NTV86_22145 [Planctomycetota bacterium]|nr:hypothetical protein [Planctomycetota bacterium]